MAAEDEGSLPHRLSLLCRASPSISAPHACRRPRPLPLLPQLRGVAYLRERQLNNVSAVALTLSTAAFLLISVSCYGLFGRRELKPDVLRNFTVDALRPLVWSEAAQAGFMTVRLGFLISLLATFSLQMSPFRDSLWKLLFRQELQARGRGRGWGAGGGGRAGQAGVGQPTPAALVL